MGFRVARLLAAVLFAVAALNHAVLAARGVGDVARHELFVAINLAVAPLVAFRPAWALVAVALLSLQQLPSHGSDLVASLHGAGPVDWASLGVVLFFPAVIILLLAERRAATRHR